MDSSTANKTRNPKPVALGIGLVSLDVILEDKSSHPHVAAGGTCGNVMTILSRFGWNARPVGRLADDNVASIVMSDLERWDVDTSWMRLRPAARTPVIVQRIRKDTSGIPFHTFSFSCPSCGKRLPSFQPVKADSVQDAISSVNWRADVLFVDRVSRSSISLAEAAVEKGAIVFFEPCGISNKRLFDELLRLSHIVKYSQGRLFDIGELDWQPQMLLEIQTLGRGGLRFRTTLDQSYKRWRSLAAVQPERLRDTAGCGDWLSGGLINSICRGGLRKLKGCTFERLLGGLSFAQGLAAWNCGFIGPRGGMYGQSPDEFSKMVRRLQLGKAAVCATESGSDERPNYVNLICDICAPSDQLKESIASMVSSSPSVLN